jgi:hypothetical protein
MNFVFDSKLKVFKDFQKKDQVFFFFFVLFDNEDCYIFGKINLAVGLESKRV